MREPASTIKTRKNAFWQYQADQIIQYNTKIKHSDLLNNKKQFYALMGAIQQNKTNFTLKKSSGKNVEVNLKHFKKLLFKRKNSTLIFDHSLPLIQMPYNKWKKINSSLINIFSVNQHSIIIGKKIINLWGIELLQKNFNRNFVAKLKKLAGKNFNLLPVLKNIVDGHQTISIQNKGIYSFPNLIKISDKKIQKERDHFYESFDQSSFPLEDGEYHLWYQSYINGIPYYFHRDRKESVSQGTQFKDYFQRKRNSQLSLKRFDNKNCKIKIHLKGQTNNSSTLEQFKKSLEENKNLLMKTIKLSHNEYNELASLAIAILFIESKAGKSFKYFLKEKIAIGAFNFGQYLISLGKTFKGRSDENSRGLTQIKSVHEIVKGTPFEYIHKEDLIDPKKSAIVTILVLNQKYRYLKHFKNKHSNINKWNWINYLYYFYQGRSREITKGTATPGINRRISIYLELLKQMIIFEDCDH